MRKVTNDDAPRQQTTNHRYRSSRMCCRTHLRCRVVDQPPLYPRSNFIGLGNAQRNCNAAVYCTRLAKQVEPQLEDLVANGTLRIEWRDLAQISQSSPLAAQAGIAAANQGRFWEFVAAAYGEADPSGHPEYTMDSLTALAQKAGVSDLDKFRADTTDANTAAQVKQAQNDAYQIGIQGTPFMFIGDSFISGYRDADYIRATIANQAEHLKK